MRNESLVRRKTSIEMFHANISYLKIIYIGYDHNQKHLIDVNFIPP